MEAPPSGEQPFDGLAKLALVCAATHASLEPALQLGRRLRAYEPPPPTTGPGGWPVVFEREADRLDWLRRLTTDLWVRYVEAFRRHPVHPALYRAFDYDVYYPNDRLFAWQRANPVTREVMESEVAGLVAADDRLRDVYRVDHPGLLLRRWWDELNGWCREFMAREANVARPHYYPSHPTIDGGTVSPTPSGACPCDDCLRAATQDMVDRITSSDGFDFSRRVLFELAQLFPPSREGQRRAAVVGLDVGVGLGVHVGDVGVTAIPPSAHLAVPVVDI